MRHCMLVVTVVVMSLVLLLPCAQGDIVHIYVNPSGSDTNDGRSPSHPVQSLQHTVDLLQADGIAGTSVFVELMHGHHELTSTLHYARDVEGSATFRAYQGHEVHVVGGKRIPSSSFHHVTDENVRSLLPAPSIGKVVEVELSGIGVTDLGHLQHTYFNKKSAAPLEVSINGWPLRLAQWPNEGYVNIKSTPDGNKGKRITYNVTDNRDRKWALEGEPWTYGWWCRGWADAYLPVTQVDPHNHTITLGELEGHGVCVGHLGEFIKSSSGGYFRVVNMLSELDTPGEYYVDRTNKKLYVWPNTPTQTLTSSDFVYVSMLTDCVRIEPNVSHISFEDFTLESCRRYGFDVGNGRQLTFRNVEIKNTGSYGINCETDCRSVVVAGSEIHQTTGGIWIAGGDRQTLTPSGNVIRDNHIHDFSRLASNIGDAVRIYNGVNIKVLYNHIHHGAYTGIRFSGNDHVIANNHIHHMCSDTSDCGGVHSSGHWSYRGNVLTENYIHHVLRNKPGPDVRGVMLDDEMSSVVAQENVFYDNECHLNVGGGRDNVVRYNVFYNATAHSIQVDGRGLKRPEHYTSWLTELNTLPYTSGLWAHKYPELAAILQHNASAPEGNTIYNNVYYNEPHRQWMYCWDGVCDHSDWFDINTNYQASGPLDFVDPNSSNFQPAGDFQQWTRSHHFPYPTPFSQTGPQTLTGPHYLQAPLPTSKEK